MKKISKIVSAFVCLAMAVGVGVAIGSTGRDAERVSADGNYESVYTLDGTITGGDSGYATESEISQSNVTWYVTGNTTMDPWRIGGKGLTGADRPIYSATAISSNIAKISVTSGATGSGLSVNSLTISVHNSDTDAASGSNAIDSKTITSGIANSTVSFEKTSGASWSGKFYRVVYNVTRTSTSGNGYVSFSSIELFISSEKQDSSVAITNAEPFVLVAGSSSTALTTETTPTNASLSFTSSNETAATVDSSGNVTPLARGTTKITASFAGDTTYKASSDTIDAYVLKQTSAIPNSGSIIVSPSDLDETGSGSGYPLYNGYHYATVTDSQGEMVWRSTQVMVSTQQGHVGQIQMQANTSEIYNHTSLGNIVSITLNGVSGTYTIKYGSSLSDMTHDLDGEHEYGYFSIKATAATYFDSISIVYGSTPAPTTLSLNTDSMSLETGETAGSALTFTTDSPAATFGWATENSSYATVANGVVTAGSTSGVTVKIYVWFDTDGSGTFDPEEDLNDYCEVTVTAPVVKHTVSFDGNGATGSMESVEVNDGASYTLPANGFTVPSGKRFAGWKADGAGDTLATGASYTVEDDVEFVAQWETIPTSTYKKVETSLYNFSGDYLIVYEGDTTHDAQAFNGSETGGNIEKAYNGVNVTIADDKISSSESNEFHVASKTDGYSIQSSSGYYIGLTGSSNGLTTSTTDTYTNTISYNSGIVVKSDSNLTLMYNYASNQLRFRFFTGNQQAIALYMQVDKAEEFALELLNLTYGVCHNWKEGDDNTGKFDDAWSTLSDLYDTFKTDTAMVNKLVGTTADEHGTMIQEAMARYDLLVNKYHLTNIITSRVTSGAYHAFNIFGSDSSTAISLIVIISVVSITAVGAFYFVRRRKEN